MLHSQQSLDNYLSTCAERLVADDSGDESDEDQTEHQMRAENSADVDPSLANTMHCIVCGAAVNEDTVVKHTNR